MTKRPPWYRPIKRKEYDADRMHKRPAWYRPTKRKEYDADIEAESFRRALATMRLDSRNTSLIPLIEWLNLKLTRR